MQLIYKEKVEGNIEEILKYISDGDLILVKSSNSIKTNLIMKYLEENKYVI